MILLLVSCAFCFVFGETLSIVCDGQHNDALVSNNLLPTQSLMKLKEHLLCDFFCWSDNDCSVIPSWLDISCQSLFNNSVIGKVCHSTEMCTLYDDTTDCYQGKCLCKIGLSLNKNGRCVKGCKTYGSSFTSYRGFSTDRHNNQVYPGMDLKECKRRCLKERQFRCISIEVGFTKFLMLNRSECHLSKSGFLDVPKKDQCYEEASAYIFSTRNCKGAKIKI